MDVLELECKGEVGEAVSEGAGVEEDEEEEDEEEKATRGEAADEVEDEDEDEDDDDEDDDLEDDVEDDEEDEEDRPVLDDDDAEAPAVPHKGTPSHVNCVNTPPLEYGAVVFGVNASVISPFNEVE